MFYLCKKKLNSNYQIIVVGGGAAGFFTAIRIAEENPNLKIAILERGKSVLEKVRISGGGRCNVTHACFVPNELVQFYPRGERELKGPFHQFCTGDTVEWFEKQGVALKIEDDGRMFPVSNSSETIVSCFQEAAKRLKISVLTNESVQELFSNGSTWKVNTTNSVFLCDKVVCTTGSNPKIWEMLSKLGHQIVPPVPSLFTFNSTDKRIKDLMGIATNATVQLKKTKTVASGPVLITHWGFSGPAILRLSAWGARYLFEKKYHFEICINWLQVVSKDAAFELLSDQKNNHPKKGIASTVCFNLPKRLWERIVEASAIEPNLKWADANKKQLQLLAEQLTNASFQVHGKSTYKDEFVTAGGIDLREINFKTMESKCLPNLYFAGEIMNIDAITGGFNFQNAWTSGFIAAKAIASTP